MSSEYHELHPLAPSPASSPAPSVSAARLKRGVELLRRGLPAEAIPELRAAWTDADLEAADDLADIRARTGSLLAQALLEAGDPLAADEPCRGALRLLRRLGDPAGLHEVRALQDRIAKAIAEQKEHQGRLAEAAALAATDIAALLSAATTPEERAAALVRKANALVDTGQPDAATDLAYRALDAARAHGIATWEIFARLVLVRSDEERSRDHLQAAYARATEAGEFNLVSTIARASEAAGIPLPEELGPHGGREG